MTSNIGSQHLLDGVTPAGELRRDAREAVMAELRRYFRPEILNRVDDIVLFKPLTLTEIEHVVELMVADLRGRLADRQIALELTEDARRSSPPGASTRSTGPGRWPVHRPRG